MAGSNNLVSDETADKARSAMSNAQRQGEGLMSDVKNRVNDMKDTVREGVRDVSDTVRKSGSQYAQQIGDAAERTYNQAADYTRAGADSLERQIKDYPITTVLLAFGIGALFGMISRRS